MEELVSILIPVYNCREWVGRAIESALAQTWPNQEVVVLDDCSTDGSWEVLQQWREKVVLKKAERNGGQNVSRNALTAMSNGTWLCYLDADDELRPTAVAEKMRRADGADAVYGSMEVQHYEEGRLVGTRMMGAETYAEPVAAALEWKYPNTSSFMFRRHAVMDAGGWNEGIQNCTDYDLYLKMLTRGCRFAAAPESVSVYRQWSDTQAVHENPLRRMKTRLMLMWRTVSEVEVTPVIREVFFNSAMGVVRSIYPVDAALAMTEHAKLRAWAPAVGLSASQFPKAFRLSYEWLGYEGAERLAELTRFLRPRPAKRLFMPVVGAKK